MSNSTKGVLYAIIGIAIISSIAVFSSHNNDATISRLAQTQNVMPKVEPKNGTEVETKTENIDFEVENIQDATLEYGKTETRSAGSYGTLTYTYNVTYKDGEEVARELVSKEVTKQPSNRIVANGTKILWHCVDTTSYDKNPYNDNKCTSSTGEVKYVSDSQSRALDPTYTPGKAGHPYYNSK